MLTAGAAHAATGDDIFGSVDDDGLQTSGLGKGELNKLGSKTHNAANASSTPPWYQYGSSSFCSNTPPGASGGSDPSCTAEFAVCNPTGASGGASGPAVRVWQREVDRTGQPIAGAAWREIGWTCLSSLVPGATNVLTMQMILNEFHDTVFAKPTASIQPVGLKTLVNLPTYYELKWPEAGFEPGEADTTTLVGRRVEIEPVFVSATYIYGDGEASGPVESLGGPYPTGDVIHTYRQRMIAPVQINVTYSGRFRVDGGAWIDIPDTVTIEGTASNLEVAEAKARLYNNG
ncbi:hypothetical protein N803_05915 [Knoellia subterranea KCTC 19937]|uniref:PKD domain-containing protein n=1 Tax=Knoellia subterranea KCTC 19937 TaxID=1385521 RepID=A0A0A0JHW5_9MICO|nr:hypothetical protein N803_05915 [Knoellia subterranea KCTC 19937]